MPQAYFSFDSNKPGGQEGKANLESNKDTPVVMESMQQRRFATAGGSFGVKNRED